MAMIRSDKLYVGNRERACSETTSCTTYELTVARPHSSTPQTSTRLLYLSELPGRIDVRARSELRAIEAPSWANELLSA